MEQKPDLNLGSSDIVGQVRSGADDADTSEGTSPRVVIIILNWNGCKDTLECIASLHEVNYRNFVVLIVDNGSSDDSVTAIWSRYPALTVLETGENLGYAGGNNVGIRWSLDHGADYILILNNDTVVDPEILGELVGTSRILEDQAVLAAKIYFYNKPQVLCYGGARWDPKMGRVVTSGWNVPDGAPYDQLAETAYANGCALFAPAEIFRQVGLFDEGMFLIYEETDFCYRARKAGYKSWFVPNAKVWHKISAAIGGSESPLARYFNARNQLIWGNRHLGWLDRLRLYRHILHRLRQSFWPRFVLTTTSGSLPKRMLWSASSWWRQFSRNLTAPGNKAEVLGLLDFYRNRIGNCPDRVRVWNTAAKLMRVQAE